VTFDWRKEFKRQHGYWPDEKLPILKEMRGMLRDVITEAPTATAAAVEQPAPAKASEQEARSEATGTESVPPVEATGGGEVENPVESGASASPDFERVEIAPNQFVKLAAAKRLGLVSRGGR
jgi:hypothetical protein